MYICGTIGSSKASSYNVLLDLSSLNLDFDQSGLLKVQILLNVACERLLSAHNGACHKVVHH